MSRKLVELICGHFVPRKNLDKRNDDLAWCQTCKRLLATGHWPRYVVVCDKCGHKELR